jgi:hypothetical protein
VGEASINIEDLAALNALSPMARYHVQLSTNPSAANG